MEVSGEAMTVVHETMIVEVHAGALEEVLEAVANLAKETGFAQVVLIKISHGVMSATAVKNQRGMMLVALEVEVADHLNEEASKDAIIAQEEIVDLAEEVAAVDSTEAVQCVVVIALQVAIASVLIKMLSFIRKFKYSYLFVNIASLSIELFNHDRTKNSKLLKFRLTTRAF